MVYHNPHVSLIIYCRECNAITEGSSMTGGLAKVLVYFLTVILVSGEGGGCWCFLGWVHYKGTLWVHWWFMFMGSMRWL